MWLDEQGIDYVFRDIKKDNPKETELKQWLEASGYPGKKFFNTRGKLYRELQLKDRLPEMSLAEQAEILATDGLLVKRPLLIGKGLILVGFNEKEWKTELLKTP